MNDWWERIVAGWWPGEKHLEPTPQVRRWLTSKRDVVDQLCPSLIGEIGVRTGRSAFAMLSACPDSIYVGFDVNHESYHSDPGAVDHARKLLSVFPRALIIECDSHQLTRVPAFDLLHVDGDHSRRGCTLDLELARRSEVRYVLVDDYDNGDVVRRAVDQFVDRYALELEHIDDGFRGSALVRLR